MSQGVSGPVVINIRDGVYANDSIYLVSVTGLSALNTLTFQSESLDSAAVTISQSQNEVVYLGDSTCQYINISDLTLNQTGAATLMSLQNGPHHCTVERIHFQKWSSGGYIIHVNNWLSPVSTNLTISHNEFDGTGPISVDPIFFNAYGGTVVDSVTLHANKFVFTDSAEVGVIFETNHASNLVITDNYFFGNIYEGIYLNYMSGEVKISGNQMYLFYDGAWGIDLAQGSANILVENNLIKVGTGVSNYDGYGVSLWGILGNMEVVNNTISSDAVGVYINVDTLSSVSIVNNHIHVDYQGVSTGFRGIYNIYNNYPIYSDYNAFYTNVDFAKNYTTILYPDLLSYTTATGNDANSFILTDPQFYDDSLDIHTCNVSLIGSGDPATLLAVDVDGEPRSATNPSIGADYFEPINASFTYAQNGYDIQFTNTSVWADVYSWDFGDGNTNNEENPMHTYASNGSYSVTLSVSNNCGSDDTTIIVSLTVGLDENEVSDLNLYPNPTNGTFTMSSSFNIQRIQVYDQTGREINSNLTYSNGNVIVSELTSGVYFIEVLINENKITRKVIVR